MIIDNKQFNFSPKILFRDKGQTLIEAIVTIGVALVIIASIVSLVNASNRRSTNARQATQASKLAQEGLEIVRNIRDVDSPNAVKIGTCSGVPCKFSDLYLSSQGSVSSRYIQSPTSCANASWCLVNSNPDELDLLDKFQRTVEIADTTLPSGFICSELNLDFHNVKRVTVTVSWDSPVGSQERTTTTCLTKR